MKESDICEDTLVEILCRLSRKSRCRFKCVSKQWFNLLSNRSIIIPKTTEAGLVFQCLKHGKPTFLRLDNRGGASVEHSISSNMNEKYRIYDSTNGFLLLLHRFVELEPTCVIYNPITKFSEHVAVLPAHTRLILLHVSLIMDGNHFKVIILSGNFNEPHLIFDVYPSEDKKWRRKKLKSPHGRGFCPYSYVGKSLFFKKAMHWPSQKHILIYHLEDEFCKLIELPIVSNDIDVKCRHIWAFEGRLHFCTTNGNRFDIWALHMEEQSYIPSCRQCFQWQHRHSSVVSLPNPRHSYLPFAFNEDLEILYLQCGDAVISYILETRELKVAYACPRKCGGHYKLFNHAGFPFLYVVD